MRKTQPVKRKSSLKAKAKKATTQLTKEEIDSILQDPTASIVTRDRLSNRLDGMQAVKSVPRSTLAANRKITLGQDFDGPKILASDTAVHIDIVKDTSNLPRKGGLDTMSVSLLIALQQKSPKAFPEKGLPEGAKGTSIPLSSDILSPLIRRAAIEISDGADQVLWNDGINQLLVEVAGISVEMRDKRIDVIIPISCDQSIQSMRVPFATGGNGRNAGMVLATSERPIGDQLITRIWGDSIIALAHNALLSAVTSLAASSGRDEQNDCLVPRSLLAEDGILHIETEARIRFANLANRHEITK